MSRAASAIAVAPPDAVELRIVRYRLRKSAGQALSEWAGDAFLGGDDGPSGGVKPLRTNVVHWITSSGGTVPFELPKGVDFDPDDIAQLIVAARRRGLRCAVWIESDRLGGGTMQLRESWFSGAPSQVPSSTAAVEVAAVEVVATPDGTVVTVDEFQRPHKAWLLFYPLFLLSFAWVFSLFAGALGRVLRENWQRSMVGIGQRFTATVDARTVTFEVVRHGQQTVSIALERASVATFGTAFGFTAYTDQGAVDLPNEWATLDLMSQQAIAPAVVAALNAAIGSE